MSEGDELLEEARNAVLRWLRLGREPSAEAIAEAAGLPADVVAKALAEATGREEKSSYSEESAVVESTVIAVQGEVESPEKKLAEVFRRMRRDERLSCLRYHLEKRKLMLRTELLHIYKSYKWTEEELSEDLEGLKRKEKVRVEGIFVKWND